MDSKVTLSFDKDVADKAKAYAARNNISLSRLTEFLLRKATEETYMSLEDLPVSDWIGMVAEGEAEYRTQKRSSKKMKDEFYSRRK